MSHDPALGRYSASLSSFPPVTGVLAAEVVAPAIGGTVGVPLTLSAVAARQWVAPVAPGAGTHRLVVAAVVEARGALGVVSARVGHTQVSPLKLPAADERVTGESPGARADGLVAAGFAVGTGTAGVVVTAGILALELDASLGVGTVVVPDALGSTSRPGVGISLVVLGAGAVGPMAPGAAVGTLSTS